MTTSGTYTFNLNKTQIIQRAFNLLNIYDLNQTVSSEDYSFASDLLNMMIKTWEAEGLNLWKRKQATLFTVYNQNSYQLGNVTGSDHCTQSYTETTTSASAAASATAIVVTSATGMTATNPIGIELSDGTRQWTTISSVASTTVNLNAALTAAVASGATVLTYTSKINRPLRILRATTYDLSSLSEVMMNLISFDEYFDFPNKTNTSQRPNNGYYDKLISNAISYTGTFYLYPTPIDVNTVIKFTYQDSLQDMINSTDSVDFPQEWLLPIVVNLSSLLALPYGKLTELPIIQQQAMTLKSILQSFDSDEESLSLLPGSY